MPPKNKLEDLRNHLFETLESLRDEDKPMDIDRARAVCEVAGQILDSAKVEIKFIETTGQLESGFMKPAEETKTIGDGKAK